MDAHQSAQLNRLQFITKETVVIIIGLLTLFLFWTHNQAYFWIEALALLEILLFTFFTRTISARYALSLFCQGIFISAGLMLLIWNVAYNFGVNPDSVMWSGRVVPFLEELLKITPVLVNAWVVFRARRFLFNLSDWATLAVMGGVGFSILEKYFWHGVSFDFTYGPHLGSWYFFPDALGIFVGGEPFGYVGHAAATGFIGLGIGLGLYLKFSPHTFIQKLWWILPVAAFGWVTLEHMLLNTYYADGSTILLTIGGGQLTPWLITIVLGIGLALDIKTAMVYLKQNPDAAQKIKAAWKVVQGHWQVETIVNALKHLRVMNLLAWEAYRAKNKQ